jgi:hypothetical protein
MAFNPGKERNMIASLKRTMEAGWFGADVSNRAQAPTVLSGEYVTSVNAGKTGTVGLIGSDANDQVVFPLQAAISISAAQLQSLNTNPVTIVPAPGAGFALALESLILEMNRGTTPFTGGGAVGAIYQGAPGTFLTANQMAASDVTGAAGQIVRLLAAGAPAGGVALAPNAAIQLYAATANFAAGNGSMKVFVTYSIVTL